MQALHNQVNNRPGQIGTQRSQTYRVDTFYFKRIDAEPPLNGVHYFTYTIEVATILILKKVKNAFLAIIVSR